MLGYISFRHNDDNWSIQRYQKVHRRAIYQFTKLRLTFPTPYSVVHEVVSFQEAE